MPVKLLDRNEINDEKWDAAISNSFNPLVYALSWYLDVVSPNWKALIYGDYEVIMPLPINKKLGLTRILQPAFSQQLGAFSETEISEQSLSNLLKHIPKTSVKTDLHFHNAAQIPGSITRNNFMLSLDKPYDLLTKKYNQNTKRNLKRSLENKFEVARVKSPLAMIESFKKERGATLKLTRGFYESFANICRIASQKIKVQHYVCDLYGDYAAGMTLVTYQKRIYLLFSSTSNIGKSTGAMVYLMNHFIQQHANQELVLDFEGSDNANLAQFYRGFGATLFPYQRIQKGLLFA